MTKNRCKICELLGENVVSSHGLSQPCHLAGVHQLNPDSGFGIGGSDDGATINFATNPSMNYLHHGLLNGLYLPQLKDMMLAAYLLRGKFSG